MPKTLLANGNGNYFKTYLSCNTVPEDIGIVPSAKKLLHFMKRV